MTAVIVFGLGGMALLAVLVISVSVAFTINWRRFFRDPATRIPPFQALLEGRPGKTSLPPIDDGLTDRG